ncbi:hypothetical protein EVAR_29522_1 [Eumeta japonica]|uniref:Uncharacterized protein n=1 Tax=Eumeta variegata TaxID=151549 RepID=A0A4C1WHR8_EUMVA|nr:hypothetical protein EVAR_29522_1 [Eumeta japonica]
MWEYRRTIDANSAAAWLGAMFDDAGRRGRPRSPVLITHKTSECVKEQKSSIYAHERGRRRRRLSPGRGRDSRRGLVDN